MDDLKNRIAEVERASAEINKGRKPKFGDRMRNPWAGEINPHRDGFFVKATRRTGKFNPGLWYQMTDGKGEFWESNGKSMFFLDAIKEPSADFEKWCADDMGNTVEYIISHRKPDSRDEYTSSEISIRYRAWTAGVHSMLPYQRPAKGDEDGMD